MPRRVRHVLLITLLAAMLGTAGLPGPSASASAVSSESQPVPRWAWPVTAPHVASPYAQPPHPYGAGHRGIDLGGAGQTVTAPADGVVAYAGTVVDRGVLTIDHGDGWVSSFEPITTDLSPGSVVVRGEAVGEVATGGHAAPGTLHLGARHDGEYVNPLLLLGGVPRAVLLPCCE